MTRFFFLFSLFLCFSSLLFSLRWIAAFLTSICLSICLFLALIFGLDSLEFRHYRHFHMVVILAWGRNYVLVFPSSIPIQPTKCLLSVCLLNLYFIFFFWLYFVFGFLFGLCIGKIRWNRLATQTFLMIHQQFYFCLVCKFHAVLARFNKCNFITMEISSLFFRVYFFNM